MKKGCLIKILVITTIVFASIFYIFTNKMDDWVVKPLKGLVRSTTFGKVENKIESYPPSPYKDSLKVVISNYFENFEKQKNIDLGRLNRLGDSIYSIITDSVLTTDEFEKIIQLIEANKNYEK